MFCGSVQSTVVLEITSCASYRGSSGIGLNDLRAWGKACSELWEDDFRTVPLILLIMRSKRYGIYSSCMSVCMLPRFLHLHATREQNSNTRRFLAAMASF